jgi:hypothetical protein
MTTPRQEHDHGSAIEVHGFSCESRTLVLHKLHIALAASGCWLIGTKRGRASVEYRFEIELAAALDLYCGLVHAGLQMTELTHRTLTGLCVLRTHGEALSNPQRVLRVRLVVRFVEMQDHFQLPEVTSASA